MSLLPMQILCLTDNHSAVIQDVHTKCFEDWMMARNIQFIAPYMINNIYILNPSIMESTDLLIAYWLWQKQMLAWVDADDFTTYVKKIDNAYDNQEEYITVHEFLEDYGRNWIQYLLDWDVLPHEHS